MESKVKIRNVRSTPRKARLVADAVRGKMVGEALNLLDLSIHKKVAVDIAKIVKSAMANIQSKHSETTVNVDEFRIKEIRVDAGQVMKRYRARAKGSASGILKRRCHISVTVAN
ncbi:MAG: 50S ribosomal protein L22 [Chitinispirillaceae bacterium]|nr:50S ribosomal protein L22 [Chitinispirillaceae bacterium]